MFIPYPLHFALLLLAILEQNYIVVKNIDITHKYVIIILANMCKCKIQHIKFLLFTDNIFHFVKRRQMNIYIGLNLVGMAGTLYLFKQHSIVIYTN